MFTKDQNDVKLADEIDSVLTQMDSETPDTDRYNAMRTQLSELYKIKNENRSRRVSPDTLANIAANLLGITVIVGYEQTHVVTTKALGFLKKLV